MNDLKTNKEDEQGIYISQESITFKTKSHNEFMKINSNGDVTINGSIIANDLQMYIGLKLLLIECKCVGDDRNIKKIQDMVIRYF